MIEKEKYLAPSPVKVDQKELISLSGIGKIIQLDPSSKGKINLQTLKDPSELMKLKSLQKNLYMNGLKTQNQTSWKMIFLKFTLITLDKN